MEQAKKQSEVTQVNVPEKEVAARGFFWFVAQGSLLKGPYSTHELKKLIDKKEISEKYFAWRDGFKEWRPLYGIDELNLQHSVESTYPLVPVPGMSSSVNAPLQDSKLNIKSTPVFKVRFSRSRWTDIKKSEVIGFFLVSLLFMFCFLYLSVGVFEKEWNKVWGKRVSALPYYLGRAPDTLPLYMLSPLLSAPGLLHQEEHWVPVEAEGNLDRFNQDKLGSFQIEAPLPKESRKNMDWDMSHTYTRQVRVQGYLNLKNPRTIRIEEKGLPFQSVMESPLPEGSPHP